MSSLIDKCLSHFGYYTQREVNRQIKEHVAWLAEQEQQVGQKKADTSAQKPQFEVRARYFVSFMHKNGVGQACIDRSHPISSGDDITSISEFIKIENNISSTVVILNWKQFDPPLTDDGGKEGVESCREPVMLRLVA